MLPIIDYSGLDEKARRDALSRPSAEKRDELVALVRETIARVRTEGDVALLDYAQRFDGGTPVNLKVPTSEVDEAVEKVGDEVVAALRRAIDNVRRFHSAQLGPALSIETSPGVHCERIYRPIDAVGLYVPGGSAPLPSALIMSAIPASLAGCTRRVMCSPGTRFGRIDPVILTTARLCGIDEIFAIGGAQAIAAMAYGTSTIPKVDKIFGPGSAWVTAAKQLVAQDPAGAAFDLPAGPSEVLVIADDTSNAAFIAADLLAQAEHDPLSQAILLATSSELAEQVRQKALEFRRTLSRGYILDQSLCRSRILICANLEEALRISNDYAPEHLILQVREPRKVLDQVRAAGSVFLGSWSPEPMGDYCSGTNHVLPTYGYARAYSGLSISDFQRRITVQELTPDGLRNLGPAAATLARVESLDAHALAVDLRLETLGRTTGHANGPSPAAWPTSDTPILALARPCIRDLRAYEHAQWDARFERLHANESPWPPPIDIDGERLALNRYPEPQPSALLKALATAYGVDASNILASRGSDEGIDLLTRVLCTPGRDTVIVCPPTFGMYTVAASTQDTRIAQAPLTSEFELDVPKIEQFIDAGAKILWLCSPNNPTGNLLDPLAIESLLERTRDRCIVVIDEAYAEYSEAPSWTKRLAEFPQLVVLRTLSKAYGLAGARIGAVIAAPVMISLLRKIVPPYALSSTSIDEALRVLAPAATAVVRSRISLTLAERQRVVQKLALSPLITKIHRSDSNFVLVESNNSVALLRRLSDIGILVRDFTGRGALGNAVRITIGAPDQNDRVIHALRSSTLRNPDP